MSQLKTIVQILKTHQKERALIKSKTKLKISILLQDKEMNQRHKNMLYLALIENFPRSVKYVRIMASLGRHTQLKLKMGGN